MSELRTLDHYVTVRNGSRHGFLLGPYDSRVLALDHVDEGRKRAETADPFAHFYEYGTASLPMGTPKRTVFGR